MNGIVKMNTGKKKSNAKILEDEFCAALALADAAQAKAAKARAEAAKAGAEANRAIDDAIRKGEALKSRMKQERARADDCAEDFTYDGEECSIHSGSRELLVKALGMLGSDHVGERAAAALMAEKERAKLGKTWNELIAREYDDGDDDVDDDDEDYDLDDEDSVA